MIREDIKQWIKKTLSLESDFSVDHPKEMSHGDYAVNIALIEGKKQGKNPKELAEEFVSLLNKNLLPEIGKIEIAGPGFINIFLTKDFFAEQVQQVTQKKDVYGNSDHVKDYKVIIEYTDPNPFKEFHIGHLMPNVIGESLSRIIEAHGADLKRANYQGDVGLHVAKAIWAMMQHIDLKTAYAYGHTAYEQDEKAKQEIIEINKKIYDKSDQKINEIYEKGRKESLDYFEVLYKQLGTQFDFYFFESEVADFGKKIVEENIPNIFQTSDGAVIYKGEEQDASLHTRVFINKEGLPTYEAKELGLAKIKHDRFPYDMSIIVTANEINEYFRVLLSAMSQVFPDLAKKTKHISHGMLKLPTGKMSSRTGTIITAESLIGDVKEKILEKMADREMSEDLKKETAEIIAIGAIKYSILRQAIGGDIIFDFDKSLSFEGDSGPYLQYSYVRAQSVIKKAGDIGIRQSEKVGDNWETTDLEKMIARFPEVVLRAGSEYAPHHIATYLIELAGSFNGFYAGHKIADSSDPASGYKLMITESFSVVMKNGLNLLGIKVPQEM